MKIILINYVLIQGFSIAQIQYEYEISAGTVSGETKKVAEEASEYVEKKFSEAGDCCGEAVVNSHRCDGTAAESDGCEIRTSVPRDREGEEKREKEIKRREVRIGLVRESGCVSEVYVGKMCKYPEIAGQLFNASVPAGMRPDTKVTGAGDGGTGLKEESEVRFPGIRFIPDKTHLKDHLYDTAEAAGIKEKERGERVRNRPERISAGEAAEVKTESENEYEKGGNRRVKRLIGYPDRFSGCTDYNRFAEKGYPIGSGEVESAHRSVPQKHLKIPGACRHPGSVNPMLALRILRANNRRSSFWEERTEKKSVA